MRGDPLAHRDGALFDVGLHEKLAARHEKPRHGGEEGVVDDATPRMPFLPPRIRKVQEHPRHGPVRACALERRARIPPERDRVRKLLPRAPLLDQIGEFGLELDSDDAGIGRHARALEEETASAEADLELERPRAGDELPQVDRPFGQGPCDLVVSDRRRAHGGGPTTGLQRLQPSDWTAFLTTAGVPSYSGHGGCGPPLFVLSEGFVPKILGVDDSQTMRRILEMTFAGDPSMSVTTVEDGERALRWITDNVPDVVLADASMTGVDGYEIARRIRSSPSTQHIAVVLLASQHCPFDAEKAKQCGVDDHVLKPFETQALIDKVRDVLARPRAAAAGARAPAPAPPSAAGLSAGPRPGLAQPTASATGMPGRPAGPVPGTPGIVSAAQPARATPSRSTVAFGAPPGTRPPVAPAPPLSPSAPRPAPAPAGTTPAARQPALELAEDEPLAAAHARAMPAAASAAARAANGELAGKLEGMGLTPEQVQGVLAISREVIERVVWEVVPDLAETIIREEIRRLTSQ